MMNHTQDYMTVSKQCRQSGKLWEDPAFPANSKVLTDGNMIVSYFGRRQVASFVFFYLHGIIPIRFATMRSSGCALETFAEP